MDPLYFFELSGEHPEMSLAEAYRCIEAESSRYAFVRSGPGYAVFAFSPEALDGIAGRIALTHRIGRHLCSFGPEDSVPCDISVPAGTFSIRAKRYRGMMSGVNTQDLIKRLGAVLSAANKADLEDPDVKIRIFLSDRIHVFLSEYEADGSAFESRKVGERPFFSPISLHPKYARAAINLTGAKRGAAVLDPFCGTGGIAIEASLMGMNAHVSDFDGAMVSGCRENMDHFGLALRSSAVSDIGDIAYMFENVDAVVTDPPYGRSTHTGGEDIRSIYARALVSVAAVLKKGGRACIILPCDMEYGGLVKEHVFVQRVHGSLSRHYCIFRKE